MLLISMYSFSQKEGNSKIIIKLADTAGIYNKVKYALVNSEFIVKDNGNRDTLTTYTQEYSGIFCKATAIIEGSTITLSGVYGLKRLDEFGYSGNPKKYQDIIYYKGSQSWKLLRYVASLIGGEISFSQ
jgi:cytoplasmic iron level regulating protein YaaA (DUF328/UPF0246 family)